MECHDRKDPLQTDVHGYGGMTPKVSIVFTAYNAEQFIETSVSAALAQDYANFEVVVVDDGSTDSTERICKGVLDPRFRYIKKDRIGRSQALNEAISLAEGDFIAINDVDDLSFPFRLSYVMRLFENKPALLLIGTEVETTEEFLRELPEGTHGEDDFHKDQLSIVSKKQLYLGSPFAHSTVVFRKDAWRKAEGYNEKLEMCVDFDFYLRIARLGDVGQLPRKTVIRFINRNSFYMTKKTSVFLKTSFAMKEQFRRDLQLPLWLKLYDLKFLIKYSARLIKQRCIYNSLVSKES